MLRAKKLQPSPSAQKTCKLNFVLVPASLFPGRSHDKCILRWSRDTNKVSYFLTAQIKKGLNALRTAAKLQGSDLLDDK